MNLLLAQNSVYLPTHAGAPRANRQLLEQLAERGHVCRAVVFASAMPGPHAQQELLNALALRGIPVSFISSRVVVFCHRNVEVHAVVNPLDLYTHLRLLLRENRPDWTIVSSEGPGTTLLKTALADRRGQVAVLLHTTLALPFGPHCIVADPGAATLFREAAAVIVPSDYLRHYAHQWGGISATHIPFLLYGDGPFAQLGSFENPYVTMINPCAYKGIAIFLELAQRMPDVAFAAVPTWGTTDADRRALAEQANITILPAVDDVNRIYAQTRVLLVPSLWEEAFGGVVVEAMARAIPTLASRVGGLIEAKQGVDYLLPVQPIQQYEQRLDDRLHPVPIVPPQNIGPWQEALARLLDDREHYDGLARASHAAAQAYLDGVRVEPFEQFLLSSPTAQPTP